MTRGFIQLLTLLAAFAIGGLLTYRYFVSGNTSTENASVLLEKIQTVTKLTTVEGQFSEIYNYDESDGYMLNLWDKKVLVRVRATVSAGYDLERMQLEADPLTKTVRMSALPEPQILSIDHTLDYYDISEGYFTSLTPEDYNRINQRAKDMIREKAGESTLLPAAREQAAKMLDLIRFMTESAGWKLVITGQPGVLGQ